MIQCIRRPALRLALACTTLLSFALSSTGSATGLATCESGPRSAWQSPSRLEKQLRARGWKVNRIKEDGGCYEVYAIDERGERVEAYFHPVTLASVPTHGD